MEGARALREAMRRISGWRSRSGNYAFPLEHKLFHYYVRMTRQTQRDVLHDEAVDRTPGVMPSAPV
jgi:hypothetical protein